MKQKLKYLSNKELLHEINESKKTFCYFVDPAYQDYDYIVDSVEDLKDSEVHDEGRQARAKRLQERYNRDYLLQDVKPNKEDIQVDTQDILLSDVVFRVMTDEHIPENEKNQKRKLPFPAFKHYIVQNGKPVEVGRSHWRDGLQNGQFSDDHGYITDRLARMFMKLVQRYANKPNWRNYTYLDEMQNQALLQLSAAGLKFNERKSLNPFAFLTTVVTNAFRGTLNTEKKNQKIRDDLLQDHGYTPSFTRQLEQEKQNNQ